jgi:fumarate hydratase class II
MDIMSAIAAGTKALEALKAIQDINKQYDAAAWKAKVAELMSDVADMKLALIDANENIRQLENEKKELNDRVAFKVEKTRYENGFLYEVFDNGTVAELPFCQNCMANGKLIRIARAPIGGGSHCPGCKTHYDTRSVMHR